MKKLIACIMTFALAAMMLTACSGNSQSAGSSNKIKIVATTFPEYDWVKQVLGDNADEVDLILLIENGVDLHSYQPSVSDVAKISSCDLFVYGGGPSDDWVKDALKTATNNSMITIDLIETLGSSAKEEVLKEGMQDTDEHDGISEDPTPGVYEVEVDEHVWLSLRNAKTFVDVIAQKLSELDETNAATYTANAASYITQLNQLDSKYQETVTAAEYNTLVFADRFPFRYMVDDYGLDYYAAFPGCSAETEASFETIIFLSNKLDELGLKSVIAIEDSDQSIAHTVVQNTKNKNQQIRVLDSMQSVSSSEINSGTTYLSLMEKNLDVLKAALNQ